MDTHTHTGALHRVEFWKLEPGPVRCTQKDERCSSLHLHLKSLKLMVNRNWPNRVNILMWSVAAHATNLLLKQTWGDALWARNSGGEEGGMCGCSTEIESRPNGWLCKPQTFGTSGAKYIYLNTQQDRHTYTFIYKETNRTPHMVHIHVLSQNQKQPYWSLTCSAMNHDHQPVTETGRHAHVKFSKHAAKILAVPLSRRELTNTIILRLVPTS